MIPYTKNNPQVSVYTAVLTYEAMVFVGFNTYWKDYKYITRFVKIAIEAPISLYTNMAAVLRFPL